MRTLPRAVATAAAATVLVTLTTAAAPARPATVSWSRILDWLTGHTTSLSLPVQQSGTAAGKAHYVSAAATRAGRGAGTAPGKAAGQLPLFTPHRQTVKPTSTGPGSGNGSHSFNPRTSVPVPARSDAMSTMFHNADGTYTRRVYTQPVNFRAPDGTWRPIDTALRQGADGRYRETANSVPVSIAAASGGGDLVTAGFGKGSVSYGLQGSVAVPVQVSGSTAPPRLVARRPGRRSPLAPGGWNTSGISSSAAATLTNGSVQAQGFGIIYWDMGEPDPLGASTY
ncbi:MAG TPA: hypothetical protein VGS19_01815 [Streptosporangiaceae bacterium]|nr:hypothetical protein [Streptosporangiaceae bacterium]